MLMLFNSGWFWILLLLLNTSDKLLLSFIDRFLLDVFDNDVVVVVSFFFFRKLKPFFFPGSLVVFWFSSVFICVDCKFSLLLLLLLLLLSKIFSFLIDSSDVFFSIWVVKPNKSSVNKFSKEIFLFVSFSLLLLLKLLLLLFKLLLLF